MIVNVRLHASLRRPVSDGYQNRLVAELDEGATVSALVSLLEIDIDPKYLMVLINRKQVELKHTLRDGDEIHLFPPISGGLK